MIYEDAFYRAEDSGYLYMYYKGQYTKLSTQIDIDESNKIIVSNDMPNIADGSNDKIYIVGEDLFIFDENQNNYILLNPKPEEWILEVQKLPETGKTDKLYKIQGTKHLYIWTGTSFEEVGPEQKSYIKIVKTRPEVGEEDVIYKIDNVLWHWNSNTQDWERVSANAKLVTEISNLKVDLEETLKNMQGIDEKVNSVTKTIDEFNTEIDEITSSINSKVNEIDTKIEDQNKTITEQISSQNATIQSQLEEYNTNIQTQLSEQNSSIQTQLKTQEESFAKQQEDLQISFDNSLNEIRIDFDEFKQGINDTVDGIIIRDTVMDFPLLGEDNKLYKALNTQKIYYWDSNTSTYELLKAEAIEFPEVKGGIKVIPETETLPSKGESDMLYKTLSDEKVYTWNESTTEFVEIGTGGTSSAAGGGIIVVDKFEDLPRPGKADTLYKVLNDQLLYNFNTLTNAYEPLGQSGGDIKEGFNITIQSSIDRIFAAIKGEPIIISFTYSSIDSDGLNDGPGIGTLYVNDVKKATVAIPQKLQDLDITKYLTLGENNVSLIVENSEGAEKAKTLIYSIELIDLYLTSNVKPMDIYNSEIALPFQITGSGTKKLFYYMDDVLLAEEEITSTNVYSHTFRVPMQTAGDHILKIHAEREVNNMTIKSNILTFGMMYINNEMVDTFILSNFEQKESAQGEIITIPYLVYNPHLETANVILTIYNEDGSTYFTKEITVDQKVQNWVTQDYPAGKIQFKIQAHSDSGVDTVKQFIIDIEPSTFELSVIRDSLALEFSAAGRSNSEPNPEHWEYYDKDNDITYTGEFERFAWSGADGWVESDAGETVLRLLPKNYFTIPFYPFKEDKRNTGYTIEIELETRDVANQDAVVLSCMSDGRGLQVNAQQVFFKSALAETSMYFKEDERVRITIVVEASTQDRVIYMFINGIICAATTYEENDSFQQSNPVPIVIGSDDCGIDVYKIRFYNRSFSFNEQLNNYMCDRSTNAERFEIKERNDIYDISNNITIGSLPPAIPYLVMQCEELPQFKGDKKKEKSCYFVDQLRPERCFSATGVQFDVQGTSSAGYPIKNFKVKFDNGIVYNDGTTADGYPIVNDDDLISKCLCLKADYASSEQANNVVLVDFYEEVVKDYFLTPAQETEKEKIQQENPKMEEAEVLKKIKTRTGISGRPIVVFWENTATGEIKFQGQYNMNNDKSNENVFGFDRDIYPQLECWEFCNNTSDRCLFKESEYEELIYDEEKKKYSPAWMADFEPRFPDLDDTYSDYTNYKRLTDWVVSTRQDQATGNTIPSVTYDGITYNEDTAEYRLAKFKAEFEDYFIKEPIIFYYIFTEVFLMIDSRAKNMFLTSFDGQHWFPIPYDMDTAIGINNEGKLVFDYDLEDTDYVDNAPVYNGQESTLWINVRDAFLEDIYDMYDKLRTSNKFSYEIINEKMNKYQEECWPESIWNEDAKLKYVDVFLKTGTNYLEMCQGNKKTQREWWLYNTFKYRDSKYRTGDAQKIIATFRAYAPDDMYITPYQHLWPRVDFTDSYPVTKRSKKNVVNKLENPLDTANDTEMFIRSADRISSFGDLSKYLADTVNFAAATKLQDITLGSDAEGYTNYKLSSLAVGNNRLLTYLNVENCTALNKTIDVSQCFNLETIDAFGSALPSITLPSGGHLMHLNLPGTISNFEIKNQHMIQTFQMESYDNLETLVVDDTPGLPIEDLLTKTPKLNCVRIVNTTWEVSSEAVLKTIFEKLKTCIGKDVNGKNTESAVVTGYVKIDSISDDFLEELNETFKELIVIVNGKTRFFIRYVDWDNTLIYKKAVSQGENAFDPIGSVINPNTGLPLEAPTREGTEDTSYEFSQWSNLPTNLQGPQVIVAMYDVTYRIQFLDGDENILNTQWVIKGNDAYDPLETGEIGMPTKTSTAQYDYIFSNWNTIFTNIISPLRVNAVFNEQLRQYDIYFYNGNQLLERHKVFYGNYPEYSGDADALKRIISIGKDEDGNILYEESEYFAFTGWSPGLSDPVIGETIYKATFDRIGEITDDWAQIIANVQSGNIDEYGYAGIKKDTITYTYKGETITDEIEFEIIGKNHDLLVATGDNYNKGASTAGLTFKGTLSKNVNMNTKFITTGAANEGQGTLNNGGWLYSELRAWLNGLAMIDMSTSPDDFTGVGFIDALPTILKNGIKPVKKSSDGGHYSKTEINETQDKIFIPSLAELNITNEKLTYNLSKQGTPYVLYTDDESRRIPGLSYWTRSSSQVGSHAWNLINSPEDMENGVSEYKNGSGRSGIVFMFCI